MEKSIKSVADIHPGQWEVKDGMARPLNPKGYEPYERDCICGDCKQDNERDAEEWQDFETFATTHQYPAPNVKDCIVDAEGLVFVWQIRTNKDLVEAGIDKDIKWRTMGENSVRYMIEEPNTNPQFRLTIALASAPIEPAMYQKYILKGGINLESHGIQLATFCDTSLAIEVLNYLNSKNEKH